MKYHHGASGTYTTQRRPRRDGHAVAEPEPPRVRRPGGRGPRARRPDRAARPASSRTTRASVLPVLMHGDAAFPGQGIVAETLNLQALDGYTHRRHGPHHHQQPARLHDRPERRALDALRVGPREGLRRPDHPRERRRRGGVRSRRSAWRWRSAQTFGRDALIDLIGYRRFGHNETDEPAYTQPLMYEKIKKHPPVRKLYAEQARRPRAWSRAEEAERIAARRLPAGRRRPTPSSRSRWRGAARDRRARARPHHEPGAAHDACPRRRCARSTSSCCGCPTASRSTASSSRSSSAAARRSRPTGASTGRTPRRSRSRRCSRRACRSA